MGARGAVGGSVPCSRTPQSWYWRRILPPSTIPAGPEIWTHNLPLTSPTRYPLGHDCPPEINMMWLDFTGVCKTGHTLCDFCLILSRILTHATVFWVGTNFSFIVRRSSCSVRSVYRGKREAISLSRQAIDGRWISDMSEILVAPREGIAQLKQSYEPTALNSVLFPSLRLRGNRTLTI